MDGCESVAGWWWLDGARWRKVRRRLGSAAGMSAGLKVGFLVGASESTIAPTSGGFIGGRTGMMTMVAPHVVVWHWRGTRGTICMSTSSS